LRKSVTENVVSDVLDQDHLHAIIEQVKDDTSVPQHHKNPREIRAVMPMS